MEPHCARLGWHVYTCKMTIKYIIYTSITFIGFTKENYKIHHLGVIITNYIWEAIYSVFLLQKVGNPGKYYVK